MSSIEGARFGHVNVTTPDWRRQVTWGYATDPDGNIIELQHWSVGAG